MAQTVDTCPPYFSSPVSVYGITQNSDFDVPPDGAIDLATPREVNRKVIGDGGTYGFNVYKSVGEDWDGDTISNHYDRCPFDAASGAPAGDTDGDTLTGLCETLGAGNGEGTNPLPGGPNTAPPWDSGQDVDVDGYLNSADNCPIIADRDLNGDTVIDYQLDSDGDGIGDVCEIDLAASQGWPANAYLIPGDGRGYPGRTVGDMHQVASPGIFVDRDNVCSDPFTAGTAEPTLDAGRWCAGFDPVGRPYGPTASGISALGRVFADSNDDADPDLLDHPAGGVIEWMDTDDDSDGDGHTDACEAFRVTDPLAAASAPPSPAGDCDADTIPDATDADPFTGLDPDADGDGCKRSWELPGAPTGKPGATAAGGVSYQDQAWFDFYDVPVPSLRVAAGTYSKSVTVGDVLAVLDYVGVSAGMVRYEQDLNGNGIRDGLEYDRSPGPLPSPPYDAGPPSGAIAMSDVLVVLAQVGLSCA
jgi:hypothetical protein